VSNDSKIFIRVSFIIFSINMIILGIFGSRQELPNLFYYFSVGYYFIYLCLVLPASKNIKNIFIKKNV
jgi:quinol-cytochrome oxidoreductase complex cytochrome b subunit